MALRTDTAHSTACTEARRHFLSLSDGSSFRDPKQDDEYTRLGQHLVGEKGGRGGFNGILHFERPGVRARPPHPEW